MSILDIINKDKLKEILNKENLKSSKKYIMKKQTNKS
jgi:hypothetical protein